MKNRPYRKLRAALLGSALLLPALILADGRVLPGRAVDTPQQDRPASAQETRQTARTQATVLAQAGQTVYTRRDGVTIRRGEDRTAPTLVELDAGAALEVLARETGWLQVRTPAGDTGYVSPLHVTTDRPEPQRQRRGIVLADDLGPGERADVTAIRGLSPVSEEYAADAAIPSEIVRQVEQMEERGEAVTQSRIDQFLREGGIVAP